MMREFEQGGRGSLLMVEEIENVSLELSAKNPQQT
jgi:hypothetical protein